MIARSWLGLALLAGCPSDDTDPTDTDVVDTDTDSDSDTETDPAVLELVILEPADGATVREGEVLALRAEASWQGGAVAESATYAWSSSVAGELGAGAALDWTATDPGLHTLIVEAQADGSLASAQLTVEVLAVEPVERYGTAFGVPESATWYGLDVDADGRVIGATSLGLVAFDGSAGRVYGIAHGLAANEVRGVLADSYGQLWLGYVDLPGVDGQRATLAADGTLTIDEAIDIDRTGEVTELHRFVEQPYGAGVGDVWIGTNEGLSIYDRDLDLYTEHLHPTHPHGDTLGVAITSDGHLWNGDHYQLSRWEYDHDGSISSSGDLVEYDTIWPVALEEPIGIRDLDADGTDVYVASELFGLAVVDGTSTIADGATLLGEGVITSALAVRVGAAGAVWIGTPEGLYRLEASTGGVARYAKDEIAEPVYAIAVEPGGTVWLGTPSGLVAVNP